MLRLCRPHSEIDRSTDLWKVLEEQILDSRVELSLREVLGIAKKDFHDSWVELSLREVLGITKKDFHDSIINLVKRK